MPSTTTYQPGDLLLLADWRAASLLAASTVRLHKVATLEKTLIRRKLGELQPADRASVATVVRNTYGHW